MSWGHKITKFLKKICRNSGRVLSGVIKNIILVDEGWLAIRNNKKTIFSMFFWSMMTMASVVLIYWSAMRSIDISASLGVAIVFAALAIVGLLFNITPGSIGIREAVYVGIYSITGVSSSQVIAFSLIDRSAQLIILGIGWMLFSNLVIKGFQKTKVNQEQPGQTKT